MKFVLNKDFGINGINKISFSEIEKNFSSPSSVEISKENEYKDLRITFKYKNINLEINYNIYYYFNSDKVEFQTLFFDVEKLYLNEKEYIKLDEDIRSALAKISRYCRKNNKDFIFEYEEDVYSGSYTFDNLDLTLFFDKRNRRKILEAIYIGVPYEDDPKYLTIEEILNMVN